MNEPNIKLEEVSVPDPEIQPKKTRRNLTVSYKLKILEKLEQCKGKGEVGVLLRREGLYSSNIRRWKEQRETGLLEALGKKRGRKEKPGNPLEKVVSKQNQEIVKLKHKLEIADKVIDAQKKISALWGIEAENLEKYEKN